MRTRRAPLQRCTAASSRTQHIYRTLRCPAPQLAPLQREAEKLRAALAARDHEVAALREIAEAAGQLQSADAQAAKASFN